MHLVPHLKFLLFKLFIMEFLNPFALFLKVPDSDFILNLASSANCITWREASFHFKLCNKLFGHIDFWVDIILFLELLLVFSERLHILGHSATFLPCALSF